VPGNKKKLRMRLHPYCFWCERPVRLYGDGKSDRPDQATIDHIFQKVWYPRGRPSGASVLSCYQCNSDRNKIAMEIARQIRGVLDIDLGRKWSYPCPECAQPAKERAPSAPGNAGRKTGDACHDFGEGQRGAG
jgi:hypothetical protein